ncbi:hypothetical protein BC940DRAFT_297359 [Gongronella butleri]|nr:hypothetical protein BC940DRAFT_297359 [Gongronella butleri]
MPAAGAAAATGAPTIRLWKHYVFPGVFAVMTVSGSFLMAASLHERAETQQWRRNQFMREQLRKKLVNADEDAVLAAQWRMDHDSRYRLPLDERFADDETQQGQRWRAWTRQTWAKCVHLAQSPAHQTIACLMGVQVAIMAGWRVLPASFMQRWFTHQAAYSVGPRTINLITASFSHRNILHGSVALVALAYLAIPLHDRMGRPQFLAFYLSAGVTSTLASHILQLATRRYRPTITTPRMGATPPLYACLAALTALNPSATPLPSVPRLQNEYTLAALLTTDVVGIVLHWPLLDHYANIAGAGFGWSYMAYGQEKMWIPLVRKIRDIRDRNQRNGRGSPPVTGIDIPSIPWIRRVAKD